MKTLKNYLVEKTEALPEETVGVNEPEFLEIFEGDQNHHHPADPPAILVMRRKSIRQFPNGKRVAMYYVDKLDKYIAVPYDHLKWTKDGEDEVLDVNENVIHHLQHIVDGNSAKSLKFKDGKTMKVDRQTAHAVLTVHKALNPENKKKVEDMAHKSREHFGRVVDFAWKHLK